jgi:hypothetical protein
VLVAVRRECCNAGAYIFGTVRRRRASTPVLGAKPMRCALPRAVPHFCADAVAPAESAMRRRRNNPPCQTPQCRRDHPSACQRLPLLSHRPRLHPRSSPSPDSVPGSLPGKSGGRRTCTSQRRAAATRYSAYRRCSCVLILGAHRRRRLPRARCVGTPRAKLALPLRAPTSVLGVGFLSLRRHHPIWPQPRFSIKG